MRKFVFAVVLVAASFVGGAAISNPTGTWEKVRTTLRDWLDSTGPAPIPSLDEKKLVGGGSKETSDTSRSNANPQSSRDEIPAAPIPSLVFDGERDAAPSPKSRTPQASAPARDSAIIPDLVANADANPKPAPAPLPPLNDAASRSRASEPARPGEAVVETPIFDPSANPDAALIPSPDAVQPPKPRRDPAVVTTSVEMPLDSDPPNPAAKPAAPAPDDAVIPPPASIPSSASVPNPEGEKETILPRLTEIEPPTPTIDADVKRTSGDAGGVDSPGGDKSKNDDPKAPKITKRDPAAPKADPELGRAVLASDVAEKSPVVRVSAENREPKDDDPRMTTWTAVQSRMAELNIERFWIEGQSKGKVRFRCVVPIAGESAVSQQFEAEGEDPIKAAAGALRRVALWKATVASN